MYFGAPSRGLSICCLRFTKCVTAPHARLASGWWLAFTGRGRTLWIPLKGFNRSLLTSPFPRLILALPSPHPAHRTGQARLTHPALGQDACFRARKVALCLTEQQQGPCVPRCRSHGRAGTTADATAWANICFPGQGPSSSFTSACDAGRGSRALAEFARVAPISSTSPLSTSALN